METPKLRRCVAKVSLLMFFVMTSAGFKVPGTFRNLRRPEVPCPIRVDASVDVKRFVFVVKFHRWPQVFNKVSCACQVLT